MEVWHSSLHLGILTRAIKRGFSFGTANGWCRERSKQCRTPFDCALVEIRLWTVKTLPTLTKCSFQSATTSWIIWEAIVLPSQKIQNRTPLAIADTKLNSNLCLAISLAEILMVPWLIIMCYAFQVITICLSVVRVFSSFDFHIASICSLKFRMIELLRVARMSWYD